MALLDSAAKDALTARLLSRLSATRTPVDVGHQTIRAAINTFDSELQAAEIAILGAVPAGVSTWLTANQAIARQILIEVAKTRKAVL